MQVPFVAHNRYFDPRSNYTNWFYFNVQSNMSLPLTQSFWDFLFNQSINDWKLQVYEQDWLYTQLNNLALLQQSSTAGRSWLKQMANAAQKFGITVQYCMPYTRHVMQSVECPAITQVRVSNDNVPGSTGLEQWKIGETSIVAFNLGLAPYKDGFLTRVTEKGCKFNKPNIPKLQTYVAALSGGPVGPGDVINDTNRELIMKTCRVDGLLLKPGVPAMSIDLQMMEKAISVGGPQGEVKHILYNYLL